MSATDLYRPQHPVRFVTAASLFDGHDAAINIMRRLLQAQGAEVIHLGHNRSVDEIVTAAVQEDVQGVAVSSYQGGHVEYFKYLVDRLRAEGRPDIKVFGGGGGTITAAEIRELQEYGVARLFSPHDGQQMGLAAMINTLIVDCDIPVPALTDAELEALLGGDERALARALSAAEEGRLSDRQLAAIRDGAGRREAPVLGLTGTGGSGKSSLNDELVRRFRLDHEDKLRIAVLAIDPSRRKGGGALLGDRIRMNSIDGGGRVFFRSFATRQSGSDLPESLHDAIAACRAAGFDLIVVETPGIGQGDSAVVPYVDVPVYVMTPEFGAASQLEKIDMLDFAAAVAINKFERRGGEDALRDVRRTLARNPDHSGVPLDQMPVFGTVASRFADDGVTALYQFVRDRLGLPSGVLAPVEGRTSTRGHSIVPANRTRYLADVAESVRSYHAATDEQVAVARRRQAARSVAQALGGDDRVDRLAADADAALAADNQRLLEEWPARKEALTHTRESLSGTEVRRVAAPRFEDHGELLRWLRAENLPGSFPYTAGVFPLKREGEDPARMFAGEGDAFRTNRRFHLLAADQPATRLSTAFDSVTLYGFDPDRRPDIYGKVGNSGVSIATLDDMKALYDGFDLCDPTTSVSMTINGPAPTILAMFFNAAIAQHPDLAPAEVLRRVRGTVQADILKEDQGQNTCIFSTEFSLRVMADMQEWFIANAVRNFYSVSISGYHIAEAGANPISQLAFTLANGFTYVESYLARGMAVDDFAPNFSFFFSNGMDPEYSVIGRVARRIWAVAMRDRYGANERSQKLKYHVQTSGRSLHAQEMAFNDIRTTLQALCAIYDNANSLHTNAYDEAVTTPTAESVRRALAIQMVINREWGLAANENPLQGSFIVEDLTDLVEEAVLAELERISDRGGVLGAMETGYQRGRIQDESMLYESRKHDGSLPIIGVNTFRNPAGDAVPDHQELARSTESEKESQLDRLAAFHRDHADESPADLDRLRQAALSGDNVFAVLMDAVRTCSLGQITTALFDVGGRYRRNV
ncbi:MAG TPA: fused isobutyryl-CoA mutase/GTPase IcmF [Acidimicrobiales bacterium]|nr:fused isobutyryl-CoA mutase/GTPase IcmF [Acidimicrobiales bacterium]